MQSYRYEEGSLHQIIRSSAANPDVVQVKPKGLKAILQSTVDFLETHQIAATLLAKFPKGALWEEDVLRYCQTLRGRSRLYTFTRTSSDDTPSGLSAERTAVLPLENGHTWRGEYFLIILSRSFCGVIAAHQVRSLSAIHPPALEDDSVELSDPLIDLQASPLPTSSFYLEVYCSISPDLVSDLLATLRPTVEQSANRYPDASNLQDLVTHWDQYCALPTEETQDTSVLDLWLVWQFQQQEHLRQTISSYRKQALNASNLSSQNEVLLNTLRLKDNFLNTVGQELRTPLSTIKTALTLLGSPTLKGPQRQRYMDMISRECDRQSALISGVLDLLQMETSLGHIRPQALQLADTVPPIVSTYQPLAEEKGIMLAYTVPNDLPMVSCPEPWLRQIVINLLNNSIKYTRRGGQVWVTAQQQEDFAELEVRDSGVGIAPTDLPNIFEHFYRGRNLPEGETEGAGLGLSIVQQLLTYCGGSIVVNSQPGSGSSFRVRFPLHQR
ncbi:MAG TPA: ATP-binding protein [Trichocoleus sp.]